MKVCSQSFFIYIQLCTLWQDYLSMFWEAAPYTDNFILLVYFEPFSLVEGNIRENMRILCVRFLICNLKCLYLKKEWIWPMTLWSFLLFLAFKYIYNMNKSHYLVNAEMLCLAILSSGFSVRLGLLGPFRYGYDSSVLQLFTLTERYWWCRLPQSLHGVGLQS